MDLFLAFILLFVLFFVIKFYLFQQKTKEGFRFHKRKHHSSSSSQPDKPTANHDQRNDETLKQKLQQKRRLHHNGGGSGQTDALLHGSVPFVENMDNSENPNLFDQLDRITDLHQIYVDNTKGYLDTTVDDETDGPIPEIPDIQSPSIDIPAPFDAITSPIQDVIDGFISFFNIMIDIFNMIIDVIDKAIFYFTCSFTLLVNFFSVPCAFWYLLNLFCVIVYFPFSFIFWLIDITDLVNDYFWGLIYLIDEIFYAYSGFHFAHFPDSILKGCYSCPAEFGLLGITKFDWIGRFIKNSLNYYPELR